MESRSSFTSAASPAAESSVYSACGSVLTISSSPTFLHLWLAPYVRGMFVITRRRR